MENSSGTKVEKTKDKGDEKILNGKISEQVLKTLSSATSIEDKFNLLLEKFIENEKTNKKLNSTIKLFEKKHDVLQREKENLQKDFNKNILMKNKLEQVCREQQKLIKSVKNESLAKIKEEEEKRKKIQAKFQESINEISSTLTKNGEENIKLKEDNIEMNKRLKCLAEQYQNRDKQLQKINEQIQLESQLHAAKLAKLQVESTIEKEVLLREKQELLDQLLTSKKHIKDLEDREVLLKEQLNIYTTKYDDFQSSLRKSNDVFVTYKAELEKAYKTNKRLEKECLAWKIKCEKNNTSLIKLVTEKQEKDEYVDKLIRQVNQLQKLLRALQAERNTLHELLKTNNIERPPMPILPEEPPQISTNSIQKPPSDKMDQMTKNCAELKQSLFKLQNQMDAITNKKNEDSTNKKDESENKKGGKQKKNKNKSKNNQSQKEKVQEKHDDRNTSNKEFSEEQVNNIVVDSSEQSNINEKDEKIVSNKLTNGEVVTPLSLEENSASDKKLIDDEIIVKSPTNLNESTENIEKQDLVDNIEENKIESDVKPPTAEEEKLVVNLISEDNTIKKTENNEEVSNT